MPKFVIEATADVQQATSGLGKLQAELGKTAATATKSDAAIAKAATGLGKTLPAGANQATNALTNLGRVVQDAPFGFIGIANNINPLLESFQRLNRETGSTGATLKTLAGSLIGGGGLGIAVSAVTAALSFASVGFSAYTRGVKESSEATQKLNNPIKEAIQNIAQESSQVAVLVESFKKENLTRAQKANIIDQLQKISPAYFANLDREKTTVDQLTSSYEAYARSVLRSVEIKVREGQLVKVAERIIELQDKATKFTNVQVDANGKLQKSYNAVFDAESDGRKAAFRDQLLTTAETKELNNLLQTQKDLLQKVAQLKQPQDFNVVAKIKAEKVEFERPLEGLFQPGKVKVPELKLSPKVIVDPKFEFFVSDNNAIAKGLAKLLDDARIRDLSDQIDAKLTQAFKDGTASAFEQLGESLSDLVSTGKFNLPNLFGGLMSNLGQQLQELGKFLITTSTLIKAAKEAFKNLISNPVAQLVVGGALVALGAIIKGQAKKQFKGFATGVRNFEGGVATVGERGAETVLLPRGSSVIPNNEVMAYGQGGVTLMPSIAYDGTQFRIFLNRVDAKFGRTA